MFGRLYFSYILKLIMKKIKFQFYILLIVSSVFASCGYRFAGSGSTLPKDIKTFTILPVENKTTFTGLEFRLADALRGRFERFGVVKLVKNDADATLKAVIEKVESKTRSVQSNTDIAQDEDMTLTVKVEILRKNGAVLYKDDISVSEAFAGTSDTINPNTADFALGEFGNASATGLNVREAARGQQETVLEGMIDEAGRLIYQNGVAADF